MNEVSIIKMLRLDNEQLARGWFLVLLFILNQIPLMGHMGKAKEAVAGIALK